MKSLKIYIISALAALPLVSCIEMMKEAGEAEIAEYIDVAFKVNAMTGFVDADGNGEQDPNFNTAGLNVRFVNYDENLVVEAVTNEKGIAIGKQLIPGNYTVSVSGGVENEGTTYYLNGSVQNTALTQTVTEEEAESGSSAGGYSIAIRPAPIGQVCFKEIFYAGSPGYYFRNQFYEIYNNSDEVYYLDHLCFAQLEPSTATENLPDWPDGDGLNNYVFACTVWQFPGTGKDYPLYPGESVIVAQEGANHTLNTTGTGVKALMDNSKVEFETWSGNEQRQNKDVPDLKYVFWSGRVNSLQWLTSVFGSAFCLYNPGRELEYNDNSYWVVGETMQHEVGYTTPYYARIPAEQIIDGVELIPTPNDLNMKRIPGFVDAGAASVGATYNNMSVCRKVVDHRADGTPIYQDTNNSTDDFEVMSEPKHRRNGEKIPSWSWSLNK